MRAPAAGENHHLGLQKFAVPLKYRRYRRPCSSPVAREGLDSSPCVCVCVCLCVCLCVLLLSCPGGLSGWAQSSPGLGGCVGGGWVVMVVIGGRDIGNQYARRYINLHSMHVQYGSPGMPWEEKRVCARAWLKDKHPSRFVWIAWMD